MNLGKMLRSGYAVDNYAASASSVAAADESSTVLAMTSAAPVAAVETAPVVVEKIVYVDKVVEKIVEKPVYVDRIVEKVVEKVVEVEVPAKAEADSTFFDDFVPSDWATEKAKSNA